MFDETNLAVACTRVVLNEDGSHTAYFQDSSGAGANKYSVDSLKVYCPPSSDIPDKTLSYQVSITALTPVPPAGSDPVAAS